MTGGFLEYDCGGFGLGCIVSDAFIVTVDGYLGPYSTADEAQRAAQDKLDLLSANRIHPYAARFRRAVIAKVVRELFHEPPVNEEPKKAAS